jgi:hypothetical protein
MDNGLSAILVGLVLGSWLGFYVARRSERENPIKGGAPAKVFHLIGAVLLSSVSPMVLSSAFIFRVPFGQLVLTAFAMLLVAFAMFIVYAVFDAPKAV